MKKWKKIVGQVALAVAALVVFFGGVELAFFLTGRFEPVRLLERVRHGGKEWWATVPEFGEFALRRDAAPQPQKIWVPVEKRPGTLRVVVVGESAAAGFPGHEFSLARMVDALWRERFPDKPIEVVNLTMVGVSSHLLRGFVREAMAMEPDAVVLYLGHNEVIGPYGPAGRLAGFFPSGWMAQASLAARNTRTGRFLEWVAGRFRQVDDGENVWKGLGEFSGARISADDAVLDAMAAQTKANVRSMAETALRGGSKVLVCVPAVNLTDWPPMASQEGGVETSARVAYERARQLWGNSKCEMGNANLEQRKEAWKLYRRACDLDEMRFRADSRVRGVQREVVEEMTSKDVMLVDADFWLHEGNPRFQTDRDFFLEHVHLTFEGRVAVAALMVDGLAELLEVESNGKADAQSWWEDFPKKVEAVRERTLFTELHESRMLGAADSVVGTGIFSGMPDVAERRDWLAGRAAALERRALEEFDADGMRARHARAVAANPEDPWPDVIASQVFFVSGRKGEAMGFARIAHGKAPNVEDAVLGFCLEAMRAGRMDEAMGHLKELERLWPRDELLPKLYEEILGKGGDMAEAVPHLKRRAERDPRNFKLWNNLAMAQQKAGAPREAAESYRRGLDLQPDDAAMLNNLAWLLATLGGGTSKERQEAVGLALRAVELEPGAHRFRGTLAVALMESGRETEGREEAEQAMEMARKAGDEEAVEELGRRFAPRMED